MLYAFERLTITRSYCHKNIHKNFTLQMNVITDGDNQEHDIYAIAVSSTILYQPTAELQTESLRTLDT